MVNRLFNWVKKYFIPHESNDHQPHFLRVEASLLVLSLVLVVEIIFLVQTFVILPYPDFFAAVVPATLVELSNQKRGANNLSVLKENFSLERAAQMKADDMARSGYFSHDSPSGLTPWYWIEKAGYAFSYAGENLAVNFFDSGDVVDAWLASPTHRANIMNSNFTEIGIGTAKGVYQGREAVFIVQMFGRPARTEAASGQAASVSTKTPARLDEASGEARAKVPAKTSPTEFAPKSAPVAAKEPLQNKAPVAGAVAGSAEGSAKPTAAGAQAPASEIAPSFASGLLLRVEKILAMPRLAANYLYLVLATIISLAIALKIFVKIKIQHPPLIVNGVILLIIIASALALNNYLVVSPASIY